MRLTEIVPNGIVIFASSVMADTIGVQLADVGVARAGIGSGGVAVVPSGNDRDAEDLLIKPGRGLHILVELARHLRRG